MEFSDACSEVDYILEHLNPEDKKKLPEKVIMFFKENKSMFYQININVNQPLVEQNLKDETKAFLQILNYKYFADEKEKQQFKEIFNEDKYEIELMENNKQMELTIYKENVIAKWVKNILTYFREKFLKKDK